MIKPNLVIVVLAGFIGCNRTMKQNEDIYKLSEVTGIEVYAIEQLQQVCDSKAQRLKTFFTTIRYPDDSQFGPSQPIPSGKVVELPGVCAPIEKTSKFASRYHVLEYLNQSEFYKRKKLIAFVCDENYALNEANRIGVIRSENQFDILRLQRTDGVNHSLSTDSIINILQEIDQQYGIKILGADIDWCEFELEKEPQDWRAFSEKIYQISPDIVEQGTQTVEKLEQEMKKQKRIFLWWD